MYFPDSVWHYIVRLSLPRVPPWKRRYFNVVDELQHSIVNRRRPTILRMNSGILCVARHIVCRGYQRRLLEYAYLNIE